MFMFVHISYVLVISLFCLLGKRLGFLGSWWKGPVSLLFCIAFTFGIMSMINWDFANNKASISIGIGTSICWGVMALTLVVTTASFAMVVALSGTLFATDSTL